MMGKLPAFSKPLPILGHFLRRQALVVVVVIALAVLAIQQLFRVQIDHAFDQRVLELGVMIDSAAAISRTPEHLQFAVRELARNGNVKQIVILSARTGSLLAAAHPSGVRREPDGTTLAEVLGRAALASGRFALKVESPGGDHYSVLPLSLAAFLLSGDNILAASHWSVPRWYGRLQQQMSIGHGPVAAAVSLFRHHHGEAFTLPAGSYSGVMVINSGDNWIVGMMRSANTYIAFVLALVVASLMLSTAFFFRFAVHRPLRAFANTIERMRASDRVVCKPMHGIREFDAVAEQWNTLVDKQTSTKQALARSEGQHRRLIDSLPGFAYICANDERWTMQFASAAVQDITGYGPGDIIANRTVAYADLIHPDDRQRVWASAQANMAAHRPCEIQYRILTASGVEKWVWERGQGVYDAAGKLQRIEGYIEDITALKQHQDQLALANQSLLKQMKDLEQADAAVRQSEQRYRRLIDNLPGFVYRCDTDHDWTVRFISRQIEQILAIKPDDLIDSRKIAFGNMIHPDDQEWTWVAEQKCLAEHRSCELQFRLMTPSGDVKWVWDRSQGVYDADGNLIALEGYAEDITALKQREHELIAARARAEVANRAKSAFIANTNHEMRTPLNAIVGFSEMLATERLGPLGNPEYREFAGLIEASGRSLLATISTIMDLSRLQSGDIGVDLEPIDPGQTVARIVRLWNRRASARDITIDFRDSAGGVRLAADEQLLCRIIDNLLSNAVKFSHADGKVRVSLRLDRKRRIVLAVWDEGIGIAREHLANVTEPFFQADKSLARDHAGIGLGLTVVRECARLHHADLDIRSTPGKGTRVTVTFPAAATVRDVARRPRHTARLPRRGSLAPLALQA